MKYPMIVPAYNYVPMKPGDIPLFIAGPVLGGGNWQELFFQALCAYQKTGWTDSFREKMLQRLKVIIPCRWGEHHPLSEHFPQDYEIMNTGDAWLDSQTMWEIHYLKHIVCWEDGFVVFGLFPESKEKPRGDGQPYARDTYGELARYTTIANFKGTSDSILVGYDSSFPGIDVQRRNLRFFMSDNWNKNNIHEVVSVEAFAVLVAENLMRRYANT
jgi:hypothetical protein